MTNSSTTTANEHSTGPRCSPHRNRARDNRQPDGVGDGRQDVTGDDTVVKALAAAVARPARHAMMIDSMNKSAGWMPLDQAVATGHAFCVDVDGDILALDADSVESAHAAVQIVKHLRAAGVPTVTVASGRPGNKHVFARVAYVPLLDQMKQLAKSLRIDVRKKIRPPLSPHRQGLPVALLEPTSAWDAVRALQRPLPIDWPLRRLSTHMADLLRTGHTSRVYPTRSEGLQALALAAVNAGWKESELLAQLWDPRNAFGEKARQQGIDWTERQVARAWEKAEARAACRPAFTRCDDARLEIQHIRELARAHEWPGRGGPSDYAVFDVHIGIALRAGRVAHHGDIRTIALGAGLGEATVARAHRRLCSAGWLTLMRGGRRGEATLWRLRTPVNDHKWNISTTAPNDPKWHIYTSSGGAGESYVPLRVASDVWRHRGLGKRCQRVWTLLEPEREFAVADVAATLTITTRSARRQLYRLALHGLAVRSGRRWRRGAADLDAVAVALAVDGAGARQRARHARDREALHEFMADQSAAIQGGRMPWRKAEVMLPITRTPSEQEATCGSVE